MKKKTDEFTAGYEEEKETLEMIQWLNKHGYKSLAKALKRANQMRIKETTRKKA